MNSFFDETWQSVNQFYLANEKDMLDRLLSTITDYDYRLIQEQARSLVENVRTDDSQSFVEGFLQEYQLNSEEGLVMMSIAEALLRIPDKKTQDVFIQEKLIAADWHHHLQNNDSIWLNLINHSLGVVSRFEKQQSLSSFQRQTVFTRLTARLGMPLIRNALRTAMQFMANQFIYAESMQQAIKQACQDESSCFSFDCLGESAMTLEESEDYLISYSQAIESLALKDTNRENLDAGISIKLSALFPRYEIIKQQSAVNRLTTKLFYLVKKAKAANINVTIDAEESERLEMSLRVFFNVFTDPEFKGWSGLGLAVQAYQKRAFSLLHWLAELSDQEQKIIPVRLVKGAYWDNEIKKAQLQGLNDYPVYSQKLLTDLSYLACSRFMLSRPSCFFPQFATHNAHTLTAIRHMAGENNLNYEFQRLFGMGQKLYQHFFAAHPKTVHCRVYAPIGDYQELLPYLVRRLLENGANSSFIHQLQNKALKIDTLVIDPYIHFKRTGQINQHIARPPDLFGKDRLNSSGCNLSDPEVMSSTAKSLNILKKRFWHAFPHGRSKDENDGKVSIINPSDQNDVVGELVLFRAEWFPDCMIQADKAYLHWRKVSVVERAELLNKTAYLLQLNQLELVSLCQREAGKTLIDALAEIREAIDFCRYYAYLARKLFSQPIHLDSMTGETNQLIQWGRGVFLCISPWNFPVAIFVGQIAAALVSGNSVVAKPARQTSLIAMKCIELFHQAGFSETLVQFLPADGSLVSENLLQDPALAGVAFTGSNLTARLIHRKLAERKDIIPLIAETGGQNVMIADNSAHRQQLIHDVLESAFNSAGQRCSALRVLYLPDDSADDIIKDLKQAMRLLDINDPGLIETDIGPLISERAWADIQRHVDEMKHQGKTVFQLQIPDNLKRKSGCYFAPTLIEIAGLEELKSEVFGPVLHWTRYSAEKLDQVIDAVNQCEYGLTLGVHSRINYHVDKILQRVKVGNIYINRNMIGAAVGQQPFGGMGFSGTGPKAGGPHYLFRFMTEQTVTVNTAALGGDLKLLSR